MALLIYAGLTVVLVLLALRSRNSLFPFLLQLLPLFFLISFLWITRDQYRIIQIHKNGYQFEKVNADYREPSRWIFAGGSSDGDDIYVSGLPEHAIRFTPSLIDSTITVEVIRDGVLLFRNGKPLNVVALRDGDRIAKKGKVLTYSGFGSFRRGFAANGKQWNWPKKTKDFVREPVWVHSLASQGFFLSDIAEALGASWSGSDAVTVQTFRFSFSKRPIQMNQVLLIYSAGSTTVNDLRLQDKFQIQSGDHLEIISLERNQQGARFRSRAHYVLKNTETFHVYFHQPQTSGVKEELLRQGSTLNKPLLITTSDLPYSIFPTTKYSQESAHFENIFAFVQTEKVVEERRFPDRIKNTILEALSLDKKVFEVVTDQGTSYSVSGEQIAIGGRDKILLTLEQVRYPWKMMYLVLLLWILKMVFQTPFFAVFQNLAAQWMILLVDFFLITRLLFGFRAASLYPFSQETVPLALYTILIFPYLLFAFFILQTNWNRKHFYNLAIYSLAVWFVSYFFFFRFLWLTSALLILVSLLAILRNAPEPYRRRWLVLQPGTSVSADRIIVSFLILAFLFQFFDTGEALHIAGIRIPLSIFYHPLFLFTVSYYLYRLWILRQKESGPEAHRPFGVALKLAGVFIAFFLLSFWMADLGFFLVYCIPVLFITPAVGIAYLREYELSWKAIGAILLAPAVLLFFLFSTYSTIGDILPESYFDNKYVQRLLLTINPVALQKTGVLSTEKLLGHQRLFLAYAHSGWWGGGYMNRPIHPGLTSTALNDNVSAAFLLNDFGLAGLCGVLLIVFTFLYLWRVAFRTLACNGPVLILSLFSLLTILYTDLYMILANSGVFLFTGKNVFLWGLNSLSDVFHAAVLFAFVTLPFSGKQIASEESMAITQPIHAPEEITHA